MDSKILPLLCIAILLSGCFWWDDDTPMPTDVAVPAAANDKGYADSDNVSYWFPKNVTPDNMPDPIKAQRLLEEDLVQCGYETRDHRRWAANNDPVTNEQGDVVDKKGVNRSDTSLPLPDTYQLYSCMDGKGWIKLKHYYTTPY